MCFISTAIQKYYCFLTFLYMDIIGIHGTFYFQTRANMYVCTRGTRNEVYFQINNY